MKSSSTINNSLAEKSNNFFTFFAIYSVVAAAAFSIWASALHSHLIFVACFLLIGCAPYALYRYSCFEPISIYLALLIPALSVKPLLNEYLSRIGESFLFYLSGNEKFYEKGFPFATFFILAHTYTVHVVYSWATRHKRRNFFLNARKSQLQKRKKNPQDYRLWKRTMLVGLLIYIPAFIYFVVIIQNLNYSEYAVNRNELLRGQGLAWLLACLGTPLAIVNIYLFISEDASKWRRRLYFVLAMICVISGQLISPGRGNILNILIASIVIFWWKKGNVSFARLIAVGMVFIIFSFTILYVRELTTEMFNMDIVIYFLVQDVGMFDYFSIYFGQMLSYNLELSYGAQLVRNLYVFLPRIIFPSKPTSFSTVEIQDANQIVPIEVSNVSFTSFTEWLFNFGIFGIVMGSILLALTLAAFFRLLATRGTDSRLLAYVLIFPVFVVGHVKGGFSLAIIFFALSPAWVVVATYLMFRYTRAFF